MSETTSDPVLENDAPLPAEESQAGEAQPTPTPETKPESAKQEEDWREKRIRQLTARHHAETERATKLEQQLESLRKQQQAAQQADPELVPRSEIDRRAAELAEQRRFNDACNATYAQGSAKFGDFDKAVEGFQLIGGASREMLDAITALDNGADVFYALGKNPGEAQRLASLPPTRMAVELARMESKLTAAPAPAPKPVSRAPAPITPVTGVENLDVSLEPDAEKEPAKWMAWAAKQVGTRR